MTDNLYVKAGMIQVDVITNESLGTGSTYGTLIRWYVVGIGYHNTFGNGMFVRLEANYMDFDGAT